MNIKFDKHKEEPSTFCCKVALNSERDITPGEAFQVLYCLDLVEQQGEPTVRAKSVGLPGNVEVARLVGDAAEAMNEILSSYNHLLLVNQLENVGELSPDDEKKCQSMKQHDLKAISDFKQKYSHVFTKLWLLTSKGMN